MSDNVTDIVDRLNADADRWMAGDVGRDNEEAGLLSDEAANAIAKQQATIATLRKQLENAREALRDIARPRHGHQALAEDGKEQPKHLYPYYAGVVSQLQKKAREALKGQP